MGAVTVFTIYMTNESNGFSRLYVYHIELVAQEKLTCIRQFIILCSFKIRACWYVLSMKLLFLSWTTLKGQCVKFSKFNHRFNGSNGLGIWNFKKIDRRIKSQMSKIGCARAVRLRQRAFSLVFALSAIPIHTQVCNIKGQISARVQLYNPQTTHL